MKGSPGYYEWTFLESPFDVNLWALSEGHQRNWTAERKEGFWGLLGLMEGMVRKQRSDSVERMFSSELERCGITNIMVTSPQKYIYRFYPVGEDLPRHRRSDFSEFDAKRINRKYKEFWKEGEYEVHERERRSAGPVSSDGQDTDHSKTTSGNGPRDFFDDGDSIDSFDLEEAEFERADKTEAENRGSVALFKALCIEGEVPLI